MNRRNNPIHYTMLSTYHLPGSRSTSSYHKVVREQGFSFVFRPIINTRVKAKACTNVKMQALMLTSVVTTFKGRSSLFYDGCYYFSPFASTTFVVLQVRVITTHAPMSSACVTSLYPTLRVAAAAAGACRLDAFNVGN